jgi:hypothetical protein
LNVWAVKVFLEFAGCWPRNTVIESVVFQIFCTSLSPLYAVFEIQKALISSVWDYSEKVARFVEVKGPGDSLSETQKVWIDVLLSAGIQVEVCKVKSKDLSAEQIKKRKRAVSAARGVKDERGKTELEVFDVEEEEDEEEGEFDYESGEEGKGEGRWEKKSKV